MEKELTIKIDSGPLKEMQELLSQINASLQDTQSRAEKGISIAANVATILDFAKSFSLIENVTYKLRKQFNKLPEVFKSACNTIDKEAHTLGDSIETTAKRASKNKFTIGGLAAVAGVVTTIVSGLANLLSSNESLGERMGEIWTGISEALSPVTEVVNGLLDSFMNMGENAGSLLEGALEIIGNAATFIADTITQIVAFFQEHRETIVQIIDSVWETICTVVESVREIFAVLFEALSEFFAEHGAEIMAAIQTVWEYISGIIEGAVDVISGVFDVIVGIFTGNGERILDGFAGIWKGIRNIFGGVLDFFSGIWQGVVNLFGRIGTAVGDAIGGAFRAVVNTIIGFAENTINGFIRALNLAIGIINLIPGVEIKRIKLLNIPKLAAGGVVDAGQLFIAREAGPELVGAYGPKTAVMNNDQIVESVARGVYNAVKSAMNGGGSYTFNINTHLDGREIGRQVIKYHNGVVKQTGTSPLLI